VLENLRDREVPQLQVDSLDVCPFRVSSVPGPKRDPARRLSCMKKVFLAKSGSSRRRRMSGGTRDGVNFRCDQPYPERHGSATAQLGLEVERKESVENVVGQKSEQQKTFDRLRVVTVDVIRVPAVDEFVEAMVLNVPAQVR